jgi:molecular chaperone GrpE
MDTQEHTLVCDCETLKKECADYKSGWQRAVADYQNLQKETSRQRADWAAMSEAQILEAFLPVYDNFKKAFAATPGTINDEPGTNQWAKGIGFIMKQFGDILKAHGVEEIKTVGELFDATQHEAAGEEDSEEKSHTIIREVDGGYVMKGKVLKVAKVIIAK